MIPFPFNPDSPAPVLGPGDRHAVQVTVLRSDDGRVERRFVILYDAESRGEAARAVLDDPLLPCSTKVAVLERMGLVLPKIVGETWKELP